MVIKVVKVTLIVLLVLIGVAFAAPFLFKGKILAFAKDQANKNLNAKVDFKDVDISFFRHFPRIAVGLEGLQIVGVENFSKDTLVSAKKIDIAVNLMSIIGGSEMKIYSITLDQPRIHAIVNKEGKANWDIVKPDTSTVPATEAQKPFKMALKKYSIEDGYISYIDEEGNMSSEIEHLDHEGSGDFTSDNFTLDTRTKIGSLNFVYSNIPYLVNTQTNIDAAIEVDNKTSTYKFKTDNIALNDLKLSADGLFQLVNDSTYNMDIKFKTPSNEFKSILSLIPSIYKTDFDKIKTSGTALFNGFVKGTYSNSQIPAYQVNVDVKEGFFQYPDLPKPVQHINLLMKVDNPDGVADHTVVDIQKGHIEMDNEPFDFRLLLKKPMTDMYVDAAAKGKLDLSKLAQFVKLEAGTKLAGLLNADIAAKGNVAVITQKKEGPFTASGFLDISNLAYSSKDFPQPIQNTNLKIDIQNPDGIADHTIVNIPAGHVEVGNQPVDFRLLIKNPVSDLFFDGAAKGNFNLANISQFTTLAPGTKLSGLLDADISFKGNKSAIDKKAYDQIATAGTVIISNLLYASKEYPDEVRLDKLLATFTPKNLTLTEVKGNYKKSNFNANGSLDNVFGYVLKDEPLAGNLNIKADKLNLDDWMSSTVDSTTSSSTAASEPFAVPKNIAFNVNASVDQVHYDKVDIQDLTGKLQLKDETVQLSNVSGNLLDGSMLVNGSYSTKINKQKPAIALSYDVKGLDIQKTFYAFNTFQKLMPIGKFLAGKMTSQLNIDGRLGEGMMPDLTTLTGKGAFLLIEGALKKFEPLDKLAQTLSVNELKEISMKDVKTFFEFANGKVLVKPFKVKVKDIDMEIGGVHGLDQSLDYIINMKVPRALLGEKGNALLNNLVTQVNNKGVPVKVGETINLNVKMGGTITNPIIKTDLKEAAGNTADLMKEQAMAFAKEKADSAKAAITNAVKDSVASAKKQILKGAQEELAKQFNGQKDSTVQAGAGDTKKKLEETSKGLINNLFKKKKATDSTKVNN